MAGIWEINAGNALANYTILYHAFLLNLSKDVRVLGLHVCCF